MCTVTTVCLVTGERATAAPRSLARTCATIQWSPDFLKSYPTAAAACRGIAVKRGIEFAEFRGTVSQVNHDLVQGRSPKTKPSSINTIAVTNIECAKDTLNTTYINQVNRNAIPT